MLKFSKFLLHFSILICQAKKKFSNLSLKIRQSFEHCTKQDSVKGQVYDFRLSWMKLDLIYTGLTVKTISRFLSFQLFITEMPKCRNFTLDKKRQFPVQDFEISFSPATSLAKTSKELCGLTLKQSKICFWKTKETEYVALSKNWIWPTLLVNRKAFFCFAGVNEILMQLSFSFHPSISENAFAIAQIVKQTKSMRIRRGSCKSLHKEDITHFTPTQKKLTRILGEVLEKHRRRCL